MCDEILESEAKIKLDFWVESTWQEEDNEFGRVVVLGFYINSEQKLYPGQEIFDYPEGPKKRIQRMISEKIKADMNISEGSDFIFDKGKKSPVSANFIFDYLRIIVRLKKEEHFVMFKLYYDSN